MSQKIIGALRNNLVKNIIVRTSSNSHIFRGRKSSKSQERKSSASKSRSKSTKRMANLSEPKKLKKSRNELGNHKTEASKKSRK
jgi:activator of HSP90 ATPase